MVMSPLIGFFPGMPGLPELLIVGAILLLLFGNRLPGVMRSLGSGVTEFKKGVQGIEDEVNKPSDSEPSDDSNSDKGE